MALSNVSPAKVPIIIYTDGSSPDSSRGPGGWGCLILDGNITTELGGYLESTTNNRAELIAVIQALETVGPTRAQITVFSDSKYVTLNATHNIKRWKKLGWIRGGNEYGDILEVANLDLWQQLDGLTEGLNICFKWVKGHSGVAGNERAEVIARSFAAGKTVHLFVGNVSEYSYSHKEKLSNPHRSSKSRRTVKTKKPYRLTKKHEAKLRREIQTERIEREGFNKRARQGTVIAAFESNAHTSHSNYKQKTILRKRIST